MTMWLLQQHLCDKQQRHQRFLDYLVQSMLLSYVRARAVLVCRVSMLLQQQLIGVG